MRLDFFLGGGEGGESQSLLFSLLSLISVLIFDSIFFFFPPFFFSAKDAFSIFMGKQKMGGEEQTKQTGCWHDRPLLFFSLLPLAPISLMVFFAFQRNNPLRFPNFFLNLTLYLAKLCVAIVFSFGTMK